MAADKVRSKRRRSSVAKKSKRLLQKATVRALNRVDFVRQLARIALSERGAYWLERFANLQEPKPGEEEYHDKA